VIHEDKDIAEKEKAKAKAKAKELNKKKGPRAPEKARTAFQIFAQAEQYMPGFAKLWNGYTDEEKVQWEEKAAVEKAAVEKERYR
jgi:hypothetical protein